MGNLRDCLLVFIVANCFQQINAQDQTLIAGHVVCFDRQ